MLSSLLCSHRRGEGGKDTGRVERHRDREGNRGQTEGKKWKRKGRNGGGGGEGGGKGRGKREKGESGFIAYSTVRVETFGVVLFSVR